MEELIGDSSVPLWSVPVAGLFAALACLFGVFAAARRRRQLQYAPLVKAKGAFIGLVQIEGIVRCPHPLRSFLAEIPCVHYAFSVNERWSRTVVETYTDSDGKTQTRTRSESGWTSVASGGQMIPFDVEDETGTLRVQPEGATIDAPQVFSQTVHSWDGLYYEKGPAGAVSDSDGVRMFTETAIPVDQATYVCGTCRERQDIAELEIAKGTLDSLFLIDKDGHAQVAAGYGHRAIALFVLGVAFLAGTLFWAQESMYFGTLVIANPLLFSIAWFAGSVNVARSGLLETRNRVRQAESNLDVHLKRRHDLIPRLAEATRAYAAHESQVMETLERGGAIAVAEAYPELAAQPVFAKLQRELIDTENRIALARSYLAEAESLFQTSKERFPESLIQL